MNHICIFTCLQIQPHKLMLFTRHTKSKSRRLMEPHSLLPSAWELRLPTFLFFLFFIFSIIILKNKKNHKRALKLPPGPDKLPIIGSLHHLHGDLPYRRLHSLSTKHGPLMHLRLGQISTVVVSSSTMAREILHTHDIQFASKFKLFAARTLTYGCTDIFFSHYGTYWKKLRNICLLELLSPKRVKAFARIREEEVSNMIKSISNSSSSKPGTPIDLSELLYPLSCNILCRAAFGEKCEHKERLLGYINEGLELIAGFNYFETFPSLEFTTLITGMKWRLGRLHKNIDFILEEIITERMKKKKKKQEEEEDGSSVVEEEEDLLDVLLRLQSNDDDQGFSISLDNMKAIILDMFVGGTDTAASALVWAMSELISSPQAMKKAQSEVRQVVAGSCKTKLVDETTISQLKYTKQVIKENFRLHPPVPLLPRESRESCKVDGYDIPIKTLVLVNVWSTGRDPKHWENPNRFEPERFLESSINFKGTSFELLPFGAGRRICPGIGFGMAVVELALAELLLRFDWELPNGVSIEEFDMSESYRGILAKKTPLVLVAIPVTI